MRNTMKVANWEIKRNLKNKTFVIGLFLTPVIFLIFFFLGDMFAPSEGSEDTEPTTVFVNDQLGIFPALQETAGTEHLNWTLEQTDKRAEDAVSELSSSENAAYLFINEETFASGEIPVYTSNDVSGTFINQLQNLEAPLQAVQMEQLGLTPEEVALVANGFNFEQTTAEDLQQPEQAASSPFPALDRVIPGIFAAVIMMSIVFTGMAIFQSASQEKKDKIAEIILPSITSYELMQGKIVGYFVLGLIQVAVFFIILGPFVLWNINLPILSLLFVPETILFVILAILSYLMFAAIFAGLGATMSDVSTAGNFQGVVMMLPFIQLVFLFPVFSNPNGILAIVGTYIPFTAPGVLLMRLTMLEEWPWIEIIISLVIIVASVWLFMKLAGKIFQVGILMYGKNATPAEIWKWIRS